MRVRLHEINSPAFEAGWTRRIHPEGAIYYQNEVGVSSGLQGGTVNNHLQGVLTRCDLRNDQELHGRIMQYSSWLYDQLWQHPHLPQFHHWSWSLKLCPRVRMPKIVNITLLITAGGWSSGYANTTLPMGFIVLSWVSKQRITSVGHLQDR